MAWFLRRQKLRTKTQSRRLIPKNDAANMPPFLPQALAPTPFGRKNWFPTVLAAWTVTLAPLWSGSFSPTPPDNPPFGARKWIHGVLQSWEPLQARPQQLDVTPQGAVAASAQVPFARPWLRVAIDGWTPDAILIRQLGPVAQQSPQDQAPVGDAWLQGVLRTWEPELLPRQAGRFVPQAGAASVDNPPFAQRRAPAALAWEQPWWNAQMRDPLLVIVNDDPPYALRRSPPALAWDASTWSAQSRSVAPQATAAPVNDPPYTSRRAPQALAWDAPTWVAQSRPVTPQTPPAPVNDPPYASRRAPAALTWEQPGWNAQMRDPLLVIVNDDPPYASRRAPAALAWDLPTWNAQSRPFTPQTPAAAVNNPPFGAKPWVNGVITLWQPILPERVVYRYVTAGGSVIPGVFAQFSPVNFRASPPAHRLGEVTETAKTARLGEPTESPAPERLGSADTNPPGEGLGS